MRHTAFTIHVSSLYSLKQDRNRPNTYLHETHSSGNPLRLSDYNVSVIFSSLLGLRLALTNSGANSGAPDPAADLNLAMKWCDLSATTGLLVDQSKVELEELAPPQGGLSAAFGSRSLGLMSAQA